MDIAEKMAEIRIENMAELEAGLVKVKESVEYLVETGVLRIPEDVSREDIEKRTRIALMNTIKLKTELNL